MVLYCQSVVLRFGTLVIQFMFTRPLSCNIVVVALLFSYLLLFNGVLAGRGDTVMFLQTQTAVCQLLFTTYHISLYCIVYCIIITDITYTNTIKCLIQ